MNTTFISGNSTVGSKGNTYQLQPFVFVWPKDFLFLFVLIRPSVIYAEKQCTGNLAAVEASTQL